MFFVKHHETDIVFRETVAGKAFLLHEPVSLQAQ
ncbi:hypothetical protein FHX51_000074 [Aeriscardovia aeriphila]|uniref:Uncharacterized protein n=1 Tax=Aeriscardovia aeriphila TaxID=218139 RepID=A0A261F8V6_9BIFI|nr:hypothetical protein [Aeriscardovia aeriphila]OZG55326.1 hypothetical protein AEAE_1123 [Aeriscardovia aeriphila]